VTHHPSAMGKFGPIGPVLTGWLPISNILSAIPAVIWVIASTEILGRIESHSNEQSRMFRAGDRKETRAYKVRRHLHAEPGISLLLPVL
jgi:uncharacterized membrane protein